MQGGSIEKDHIYYIRTEGSAENVSGSTNQWFWRYVIAGYSAELNNPNLNVIVKMTSTGSIGATGNKGYINANSVMHFKIEAFDLTEDFGAGNEPTDVTFCQNYYGSAYIPNGTHYEHIDYYAMNGRNKETEVIG